MQNTVQVVRGQSTHKMKFNKIRRSFGSKDLHRVNFKLGERAICLRNLKTAVTQLQLTMKTNNGI